MGLMLAAFAWGFAEATLFFIVPDALLTAAALHDVRKALRCCVWAVVGAAVGGTILYFWGANAPVAAIGVIESVPAISPGMMARVRESLAESGVLAMILGPLSGTPFKAYAVEAAASGISFPLFLLAIVPARAPRFVLTVLFAAAAARVLKPRIGMYGTLMVWLVSWIVFYVFYFWTHPG
jgi:membrane protein YqaA with SNARE-associated domain